MRLQLADGQQSNAFSVSGSYMDWKCFQEYVVECIKKNCHTAAYEVAFGKHTPEGRASTVVAAGHMSAEFEGSDDARLLSSKVDGSEFYLSVLYVCLCCYVCVCMSVSVCLCWVCLCWVCLCWVCARVRARVW